MVTRFLKLTAMKRIGLILLACLLLALPTVAQAPEKTAPDDLVVTAEIVNCEYGLVDHKYSSRRSEKGESGLILGVKMTVRNTTNRRRGITVMSCSWNDFWTAKGAYFICGPWGCDANYPYQIIIPAGQAVEFYDELCTRSSAISASDSINSFQLGFIDVSIKDSFNYITGQKLSRKPIVYWSNVVKDDLRPIATPEVKKNLRMRWLELQGVRK